MKENRIYYDCDTYDYWCSEDDYSGESKKEYGRFAPDGKSYEIFTKDTPRGLTTYVTTKLPRQCQIRGWDFSGTKPRFCV